MSVQRRDRFKTAVAGPDAAACDRVDMGVKIQAVSITLNRDDGARPGGWVGGDLVEHLHESLPGRLSEQAEFLRVVFEDGAEELWDREDELGVADLFEDANVEQLGEEQDALLLARGSEQPAFAGIGEDGLIAAAVAAEGGEPSVQVSTFQILAQDLIQNQGGVSHSHTESEAGARESRGMRILSR